MSMEKSTETKMIRWLYVLLFVLIWSIPVHRAKSIGGGGRGGGGRGGGGRGGYRGGSSFSGPGGSGGCSKAYCRSSGGNLDVLWITLGANVGFVLLIIACAYGIPKIKNVCENKIRHRVIVEPAEPKVSFINTEPQVFSNDIISKLTIHHHMEKSSDDPPSYEEAVWRPKVIGRRPKVIGRHPKVIGRQPRVIGQPKVIGRQPRVIGQPKVIGRQPNVIRRQPKAIGRQPEVIRSQLKIVRQKAKVHRAAAQSHQAAV